MAGFKGFTSDVSGKIIPSEDYVRLRITARGDDDVLHEGEIDVSVHELEGCLPTLVDGERMKLVVKQKRGPKPKSE